MTRRDTALKSDMQRSWQRHPSSNVGMSASLSGRGEGGGGGRRGRGGRRSAQETEVWPSSS